MSYELHRHDARHMNDSPEYCEAVWRGHECLQRADHALLHECGCGQRWDDDAEWSHLERKLTADG